MIGWVDPNGPAGKAGLRPADKIISIDGHPVTQFSPPSRDSVTWRIVTNKPAPQHVELSVVPITKENSGTYPGWRDALPRDIVIPWQSSYDLKEQRDE